MHQNHGLEGPENLYTYVCTYTFLLLLPIWFVAFLLITHWIYTLSPYIFHKGPLELTLHLRGAHDWGIGVGGGEVLHSTLWCCTVIRYGMNKTCQVCIGNSVKLNYSLISTPTNFRVFALSSWILWPGHSSGGFEFQKYVKYWSILLLRHFIKQCINILFLKSTFWFKIPTNYLKFLTYLGAHWKDLATYFNVECFCYLLPMRQTSFL